MSGGGDLRNERTLDTRINRVCGDLAELAARVQRLEEQHVGVASIDVPCAECAALRERVRVYERLLAAAARGSVSHELECGCGDCARTRRGSRLP